jgi:hypothetical protein
MEDLNSTLTQLLHTQCLQTTDASCVQVVHLTDSSQRSTLCNDDHTVIIVSRLQQL